MLKFSEHRSGQRGAEADAAQAWADRQRKRQARVEKRMLEAELFLRKRQMIADKHRN